MSTLKAEIFIRVYTFDFSLKLGKKKWWKENKKIKWNVMSKFIINSKIYDKWDQPVQLRLQFQPQPPIRGLSPTSTPTPIPTQIPKSYRIPTKHQHQNTNTHEYNTNSKININFNLNNPIPNHNLNAVTLYPIIYLNYLS